MSSVRTRRSVATPTGSRFTFRLMSGHTGDVFRHPICVFPLFVLKMLKFSWYSCCRTLSSTDVLKPVCAIPRGLLFQRLNLEFSFSFLLSSTPCRSSWEVSSLQLVGLFFFFLSHRPVFVLSSPPVQFLSSYCSVFIFLHTPLFLFCLTVHCCFNSLFRFCQQVPVTARSKAWVCGRSPAEIVGSNPVGVMVICLL